MRSGERSETRRDGMTAGDRFGGISLARRALRAAVLIRAHRTKSRPSARFTMSVSPLIHPRDRKREEALTEPELRELRAIVCSIPKVNTDPDRHHDVPAGGIGTPGCRPIHEQHPPLEARTRRRPRPRIPDPPHAPAVDPGPGRGRSFFVVAEVNGDLPDVYIPPSRNRSERATVTDEWTVRPGGCTEVRGNREAHLGKYAAAVRWLQ